AAKCKYLGQFGNPCRSPANKTTILGNKGGTSWRGKPGGTPPTAGPASRSTGADFSAAQVWLPWERSLGTPCRYPATAQAFPAPTRKPAALPHPPSRRDRNI